MKATDRARGDWSQLLQAAGMDAQFLRKRHGPCPFCEGADRYRFADRQEGLWVCNKCTNGKYANGLELLRLHLGLDTATAAAAWIHSHYDGSPAQPVKRGASAASPGNQLTPEQREYRVKRMRQTWDEARAVTPGDPVGRYLSIRVPGLQDIPAGLRYHPKLPYWDATGDKPVLLGHHPAMLALGYDAAGEVVQLHKTYLTAQGSKATVPHVKKTDVGVGCNAFALRIMPVTGHTLGVAEGIETALAASLLQGIPVWACHSASVLAKFTPPPDMGITKVVVFADSDVPYRMPDGTMRAAGQEAGQALAHRLGDLGLRTMIVRPARLGTDMADVLTHAASQRGKLSRAASLAIA